MDYFTIVLRLLHIVFGAIWVGFAIFVPFILLPSMEEVGPDGLKVGAAMQRRGFVQIVSAVAGTSILAGILLFWRVSGGFRPEYMGSRTGMTLSIGALAAIVAFAVGIVMVRPAMTRAAILSQGLAAVTSETERVAMLDTINSLRARGAAGGRITAWLLLLAVAAMAVARYL